MHSARRNSVQNAAVTMQAVNPSINPLGSAQTLRATADVPQRVDLSDSSEDDAGEQRPPAPQRSPNGLSPGVERRGRDMQRSPASLRSVAPAGLSPRSAAAWAAGLSPRARLPEGLWAEDPAGGAFQLDDSTLSGSSESSSP